MGEKKKGFSHEISDVGQFSRFDTEISESFRNISEIAIICFNVYFFSVKILFSC